MMLFRDPYVLLALHKSSNNTAKILLWCEPYKMETDLQMSKLRYEVQMRKLRS